MILILYSLIFSFIFSGCGYTLQNSRNFLEKFQISKVYIPIPENTTFKSGLEGLVYNALTRSFRAHKTLKLVKSEMESDAILQITIERALFTTSAQTTVPNLSVNESTVSNLQLMQVASQIPASSFAISTEYQAQMSCSFKLIKKNNELIWQTNLLRSKPFSASNQIDVPGTTSSLINESEFERAIKEILKSMMEDAYQSLLSGF